MSRGLGDVYKRQKVFEAEVRIEGRLIGSGKGRTKKAAEQQAAYNAIMDMESKA